MRLFYLTILSLIFASLVTADEKPSNWAVLVASSSGYENYRHQSEVYRAYQILLKNGIPASNIIVFAYDDIALAKENPFKGRVFNEPNGKDVYKGVKIDYRKEDVSSKNFLKVLEGDKYGMKGIGTGRVLESSSIDNVFVYLSDHGLNRLVAFSKMDFLFDTSLIDTFHAMNYMSKYHKMVVYVEACHAGSMFANLPNDLNIYVTTASNSDESSYAFYCYPKDKISGVSLGSCLGDEYSIRWMEYLEQNKAAATMTLQDHYDFIKNKVIESHVQQFGDMKIANDKLGDFFYLTERTRPTIGGWTYSMFNQVYKQQDSFDSKVDKDIDSRVMSRNVRLFYLMHNSIKNNDINAYDAYEKELSMMERSTKIFNLFRALLGLTEQTINGKTDYKCIQSSIEVYDTLCGYDERDIIHIDNFINACTAGINSLLIYSSLAMICGLLI